jgi:hypothetical protein
LLADTLATIKAIWSINETYSRRYLAIATTLVALLTYFVTLNLNNLVRLLRKAYAPRRLALVDQMEQDPKWSMLGQRFKIFQRHEGGEHEPSEWMVMVFSLQQMGLSVVGLLAGLFSSVDTQGRQTGGGV